MSQLQDTPKQPYQVLARKYRPNNFHELVGQTHVSKALINAIDYNRLHHAYLFTGTRGVGKTTIARILAKCLNCDTGITSKPCGTCDSCQMIEQGRFIDLIEIDAASRTKVEDTRDLLDNVPYAPSQGRYKVYLIDEVHMLSTHSFNALLKTLEEPPEHVKFLLATTDPQKLPITIISRCLQFVLRPLAQQQLTDHLHKLLTLENVSFEESALWQLAHSAKGSVRDSLSLTDQAISFGQGQLTEYTVNEMLGLISATDLISLIADIYNDDKVKVAEHIEQMRLQMVDASSVFDELSDLIHKIALLQVLPTINLNVNESQSHALSAVADNISADVLQLYYEIVVKSRENIALATTPMQALEMCLLRMLAFCPLPINRMIHPVSQDTHVIASENEVPEKALKRETLQQADVEKENSQQAIQVSEPVQVVAGYESNEIVQDLHIDTSNDTQSNKQSPIEESPIEESPIEESPIEESPIEESPIEQSPIEQSPIEQSPIEQSPIEQSPIEESPIEQTSIEQSPIEQNPIEQSPIEQSAIEESPIEESPIEQSSIEHKIIIDEELLSEDPRELLKCQAQELEGEWTTEKWDYWVQTARDSQLLDKDELAFARQGLMKGDCDGESVFYTGLDSKKFQKLFINISEKLNESFPNSSYSLEPLSQSNDTSLAEKTPQNRQMRRQQLAQTTSITKLSESSVMKFINIDDRAIIKMVKLL